MDRTSFDPEDYWDAKHRIGYPGLFSPTELAKRSLLFFKRNHVFNILEIGCGRSGDSYYFVSHKYCVVSLDISFVALTEQSVHVPKHFSFPLIQADLNNGLPFRALSFDAVFSRLSLHYFSDQTTEFVFNEIYRILKSKGCIAISVKSDPKDLTHRAANGEANDYPKKFFTTNYMKSLLRGYSGVDLRENIIVSGVKKESPVIEVFAKR